MLVVGASKLNTFRLCPRLYYFSEVLRLRPRKTDDKLIIGIGYHLCLDAYYLKNRQRAAAEGMFKAWKRVLSEELFTADAGDSTESSFDDITKSAENCLKNYLDFAAEADDFDVVDVEHEFDLPVWSPDGDKVPGVRHRGTIDLVVRQQGVVKPLEHKTGAAFPNDVTLQLDDQMNTYMLAIQQLYGSTNQGLYDMSRKVGERARTATVKRWTIYRSDAELHYTVRNMFYTIRAIRHALRYKSCHERYSPGMHCSWRCPYASLCQFMNNGDPWEEIAETLFVQEDPGERASWKERITSVAEGDV